MKKTILILLVLATLFVVACTTEKDMGEDNTATTQTSVNIVAPESESQTETMSTVNKVEIDMIARQWEFEPSTITVNKGDTVVLTVTNMDVDHGIMIPEFNVNMKLPPGKTDTVEFVADKAGEFRFFCNVFCGEGHTAMEGMLIVK